MKINNYLATITVIVIALIIIYYIYQSSNYLVLTYDPLSSESKINVTDLTTLSSNVEKNLMAQHYFMLRDQGGNIRGEFNIFINSLKFKGNNKMHDMNNVILSLYQDNNPVNKEEYALTFETKEERDSNGLIISNYTKTFILHPQTKNAGRFKYLQWTFRYENGKVLPRTLVLY